MTIVGVEPSILHIPLPGNTIKDSTHSVNHWGVAGVRISTDDGYDDCGFTGTHVHLASDRLITACIRDCYAELLLGEDAWESQRLRLKLARLPATLWVGRAGITQLALDAIDVALWVIKCRRLERPRWRLLGGSTIEQLSAYNTDVGWLSIHDDRLVDGCRQAVEEEGFVGIKIKVGHDNPILDLRRVEAVQRAIGPDVTLAIDANGRSDFPTCQRFCRSAEIFNL